MYHIEDYQYDLPSELIAQVPTEKRGESPMMVLNREINSIEHSHIGVLERFLLPGDLLVLNDTKVVPARLLGRKESGGRVEVLVLNPATETSPYSCLLKASRSTKPGTKLLFGHGVEARVADAVVGGKTRIELLGKRTLMEILEEVGCVPLPPYIHRNGSPGQVDDTRAYQTIYACRPGAIAAPTAGLHFSEPLLQRLRQKGIILASLTLHVGFGTFQPVRHKDIRKHRLQEEFYQIPAETAEAINWAKANGARVIAVGTTVVRALEFVAESGTVNPGEGWCDLMIYPGFHFQIIDALLTNFHLPGSSLIMLVSAWAGHSLLMKAYAEAVRKRYRFYSYGNAMFIE